VYRRHAWQALGSTPSRCAARRSIPAGPSEGAKFDALALRFSPKLWALRIQYFLNAVHPLWRLYDQKVSYIFCVEDDDQEPRSPLIVPWRPVDRVRCYPPLDKNGSDKKEERLYCSYWTNSMYCKSGEQFDGLALRRSPIWMDMILACMQVLRMFVVGMRPNSGPSCNSFTCQCSPCAKPYHRGPIVGLHRQTDRRKWATASFK